MLQSRAGRPPLGRPAWGYGRVATAFEWTSLVASWRSVSWALGPDPIFLGRAAWGRLGGLPLEPVGPQFHRQVRSTLHIAPGLGTTDV